MHVRVVDLPHTLRAALKSVGYHLPDIAVEASETYSMSTGGSRHGARAFALAVNLATGETDLRWGSYGGPNIFDTANAVDLDSARRPLPVGFAVVHGTSDGLRSPRAVAHLHPDALAPLLPAAAPAMSDVEVAVLAMYAGLNSGGRKNQVERWCCSAEAEATRGVKHADPAQRGLRESARQSVLALVEETTRSFVERGWVTRNRAGAVTATTAGRNARDRASESRVGYGWYPGKQPREDEQDG